MSKRGAMVEASAVRAFKRGADLSICIVIEETGARTLAVTMARSFTRSRVKIARGVADASEDDTYELWRQQCPIQYSHSITSTSNTTFVAGIRTENGGDDEVGCIVLTTSKSLVINRLANVRSRCRIRCECRYSMP